MKRIYSFYSSFNQNSKKGTLIAIIRQAGLTVEEFLELL
jgi:hypothetical protein